MSADPVVDLLCLVVLGAIAATCVLVDKVRGL